MKSLRILGILLLGALLGCASSPPAGGRKIEVLVVTGGHEFEEKPFFAMFEDDREIAFTRASHTRENASAWERDDLASYDVVVLYDMSVRISDAQKAAFQALLDRGTGLVVLHHALGSYQNWPQYAGIIGMGAPEPGAPRPEFGFEHDVDIPVVIVAADHPITAGLHDFTLHDEIYWGFRAGPDVTPLVTTTQPKSSKPLAWCRTQGRSRVVFLQPGHDHSAFDDPNYRRLVAQSIRWAAKR
jgi:type 1 glutamine amidotransferase